MTGWLRRLRRATVAPAMDAQAFAGVVAIVDRLERLECALRELLDARDAVYGMDVWRDDDDTLDQALARLATATAHARMLVGRRH